MAKKNRKKKAPTVDLDHPDLYINRELSWLEFNDRVLRQGLRENLPLLERLKFLAIVSSNLDEFFMIRVAGLKQQFDARLRRRGIAGLTPRQQLRVIADRAGRMVDEQAAAIHDVFGQLEQEGIFLHSMRDVTVEQRKFLRNYYENDVEPILTPLAMEQLDPAPVLPGLRLMLAVRLERDDEPADGDDRHTVIVVPIPQGLPRLLALPAEEGLHLVLLEDVIEANLRGLLPAGKVKGTLLFRLTRDADVAIQEDAAGDLLEAMEQAVSERRRRAAVRLEIAAHANRALRKWLMDRFELTGEDVYEVDGLLDATSLWELAGRAGLDHLRDEEWPPQPPRDLADADDIFQAVQERDVMLFHPYETFEPVVRLISAAADDPDVLAIKQTLYRTSGDSPIIDALVRAARNGKQVVTLVELKARFDEARNVTWARRLEEAGAFVIYGIAGYKTHAKALLIVRREAHRIRRYVHLATGNYNDKTAKLYSDIGMISCQNDLAMDVASLFNVLTGYSEVVGWQKLTIAPVGLRDRFYQLIDREIELSTRAEPGLILAKTNSLQDKGVCRALYRASQAGVQVKLNVRGICCLRPGVPGVSDNIQVTSIVDRYLEHARIFYFRNGGHEEVYLSSADWMTRNLDKRFETLFPVTAPRLKRRLIHYLDVFFADNLQARMLHSDGTYEPVPTTGRKVRAQETFYRETTAAARRAQGELARFRPMGPPSE